MNDSPAALFGRKIAGKFLIESLIGVGAMGAVYKARQIALDKDIAVKIMHPDRASDAMYAALFQREARAASRLDHPNSVRVVDFGQEPDGLLYIAMEYFAGRDLQRVLSEDWPLSSTRVADILSQALAAIAVAHDMGMVHRDLKPENILVQHGIDDEGVAHDVVKVCDFGIAKFTDATDPVSSRSGRRLTDGVVIGTPHYMSPEQGQGEPLDARTDVYSMGVILYQLLTTRVPFEGTTLVEVVVKHVRDEPEPPSKTLSWVDLRLEAICLKALRKNRSERYQSAREMRSELRAVLADSPSGPQLPGPMAKEAPALPPPSERAPASSYGGGSAQPVKAPLLEQASPRKGTPPPTTSSTQQKKTRVGTRVVVAAVATAVGIVAGAGLMRRSHRGVQHGSLAPTVPAVASGALGPPSPSPAEPSPTASESPSPPQHEVAVAETPAVSVALPPPATNLSMTEVSKGRGGAQLRDLPPNAELADASLVEPAEPSSAAATPAMSSMATPTTSAPTAPVAVSTSVVAAPPTPIATNPVPPPPQVRPPFDPSRARVDWSVGATGGGATAMEVQRALARVSSAWSVCYQTALKAAGQRVEGSGVLHLTTDDEGNVVQARLAGFALSNVGPCLSASANVRIRGVDTGTAWADINLAFRAVAQE